MEAFQPPHPSVGQLRRMLSTVSLKPHKTELQLPTVATQPLLAFLVPSLTSHTSKSHLQIY